MYCIHCGNEVPDGSAFCTACGRQLQPANPSAEGQLVQTAPVAMAAGQKKRRGGGLAWKIISLLTSIGLIIGGLSGVLVFRGTNSSELLVVFGFLWLAYDIYAIATHSRKTDAAGAAGVGSVSGTNRALAVPGDSRLPVLSAALMVVYLLVPLVLGGFSSVFSSFLAVFDLLIPIAFIVIVLAIVKKNAGLLIFPVALTVVDSMLRIAILQFAPNLDFIVGLLADIAMLVVVSLTVNKRCASNKPFLFTTVGVFVVSLLGYIIAMNSYQIEVSMITVFNLMCYHGAYFVMALAFRPQPQAAVAEPRPL
jgi:hypothetical protein